jgi:1-acyl-sn-glycerol-3-phosphate acyltransferase
MSQQAEIPDRDEARALETAVLQAVRDLALEVRGDRGPDFHVVPTSRLDRDLGLDSLARAELLLRLENALDVTLPEALLAKAETPGDLIREIAELGLTPRAAAVTATISVAEEEAGPAHGARTLTEALDWHVARHGERTHLVLVEGQDQETTISYGELAVEARQVAGGLVALGLEPGERVAIMLPTCRDFFQAFFGILYAGGVPVPIYPPVRPSQIEDHLRRQARILNNCEARVLITIPEARPVAEFLMARVRSLVGVETTARLSKRASAPLPPAAKWGDLALLQYTSGSTGDPKGVMLTHANLLENIRSMGANMRPTGGDVLVSWLPLYHDMGLIGAWLGSLYYAVPAVIMSPLIFLVRPAAWLWAIHRHRGTLSGGPNFGYDLCLKRIDDTDIEGLDLGSLRMVVNGAEPVQPKTIEAFIARFGAYGFRREVMAPVYGLAENSVGLAFPPGPRPPLIDRVSRRALQRDGRARPAAPDDPHPLEIVACGQPLPGNEVRIVDAMSRELGERQEGRLQFRGASATSGYYRNEAKTAELFDGDWLESGDRAYIADADIFITGRAKDIIIRAGRNVYPQEIEAAVSEIEGVRKGCIAVFPGTDPDTGTERLIVLAETRETEPAALAEMRRQIEAVATELSDLPPDDVVLAPPNAVPKTSSGKIRRDAARQLYESGRITGGERALWWQLTRLAAVGLANRLARGLRAAWAMLYAAWWWTVLIVGAVVIWPLVVLLPGGRTRWGAVHLTARLQLGLMGIRVRVENAERLRGFRGILAFNHTSYADSLVFSAATKGELAAVAKRELAGQFVAGLFLKRLGTIFVERLDAEAGLEDAKRAKAAVEAGRQVVFFPEGTVRRMPGLLPFRMGTFTIAAEAGVPVLPVALRGVRTILREGQWFPRHGAASLHVGEPVYPDGNDFQAALRLRDTVRAKMLELSGEPDLGGETIEMPGLD